MDKSYKLEDLLKSCRQCPRACGADRNKDSGVCLAGSGIRLARAGLHYGEEPCISGGRGSGAVFFSGCSLKCVFCQNEGISHGNKGKDVDIPGLAEIFKKLEAAGAENINLVNPTHYAYMIIQALDIYRPAIPVIYNSGGYESPETLRMLEGYIDVYLPDYKYADAALARRFSGAEDYPERAEAAIAEMLRQKGMPEFDGSGMIRKGTVIRHLVLPLHIKNTKAVLERIKHSFGSEVWISLMMQYTPVVHSEEFKELNRTLTKREAKRAGRLLEELGFENGYIQELESNTAKYIPDFDMSGI